MGKRGVFVRPLASRYDEGIVLVKSKWRQKGIPILSEACRGPRYTHDLVQKHVEVTILMVLLGQKTLVQLLR